MLGRNILARSILRLPVHSWGNLPIVGPLLRSCSHRLLPSNTLVWEQIKGGPMKGLWMELNPRSGQQYLSGQGGMTEQNFLVEYLHPGMVFYDIGANIGWFSLLAARLVGTSGAVYSFEPDHENAVRLRRNAARNGFTNVHVEEAAVWKESGDISFTPSDPASPDHGLGHVGGNGKPVRCASLDDFTKTAPCPAVIKCDAEGAEVEVFQGARGLLGAVSPAIVCEIHSRENGVALQEYFTQLCYRYWHLCSSHAAATKQNPQCQLRPWPDSSYDK